MIKNVIFDYAGVLVDLDENTLIEKLGYDKKTAKYLTSILFKTELFKAYQRGELDAENFALYLVFKYPDYAKEIRNILNADISQLISPNPDMINLAKTLKDNNIKTFIMSNSTPETASIIRNSEYAQYFDGLILSSETHFLKPTDIAFEYACYNHNISPNDTLFIDDSSKNITSAKNIGMLTILCKNPKSAVAEIESLILGKAFN